MSYATVRSGFTGPSHKIGGSTEYHIDLKLLESLPIAERVKAVDAVARQYANIGRRMEFSNPGVSGKTWDPNAQLDDRINLLMSVAGAHGHSKSPGWQSLDFYVPFAGKTRFDKGAVEDASIYLPAVPGGKVRRGSGGGYGFYSESLDPKGNVLFKVGHGNIDRPEKDGEFIVNQPTPSATEQPQQTSSEQATLSLLKELLGQDKKPPTLRESLLASAMQQATQRKTNDFLSQYTGPSPYQFLMDPQQAMSLFE